MSTQISTQISTYTNSLLQYYTKVAPTKFQLEHSSKSMQGDDDITTYDVTTYASMRCKEIVSRYVQTTQEDDKGRTYIRDNTDVLKRELKKLYGVEWDCPPMIPMIPSPILPTPPLPTSSPSESLPSSPPKKTTTTTSQPYSAEDTNRYLQSLLTSKITSLKTTTKQAVKGVMEEKWEREREGMKREIEILRERDRVWRVVFMEGGASGLLNLGIEVPSSANDFDVKPQCNNVDDNDNVKDDTMALIASQSRVISKLKSRVEEREGMRDMVREMEVKIEQKDKVYRKMKEKVEALRSAIDERDRKIGMATAREVEFKDVVKGLEREIEDREGRIRVLENKVEEIRRLKERAEEREEEGRRRMEGWVEKEEVRIKEWAEREMEKGRIWVKEKVEAERERVERIREEYRSDDLIEMAKNMQRVRRENARFREENDHLKRELRRAAERIVGMVREREEGVKDLGFVGK